MRKTSGVPRVMLAVGGEGKRIDPNLGTVGLSGYLSDNTVVSLLMWYLVYLASLLT